MVVIAIIIANVVLFVSIYSAKLASNSANIIAEASMSEMVALSEAAANIAVADELIDFIEVSDMQKPEYKALKEKLAVFTRESGLKYTYYLRLDEDTNMMQFIMDNQVGIDSGLNEDQVDRELAPDNALSGTANAVPIGTYSKGWDGFMSAFAPVYFSNGALSNIIVGVDKVDTYVR